MMVISWKVMLTLANGCKRLATLAFLLVYSVIGAFLFNLFEFPEELAQRRSRSQNFTRARNLVVEKINKIIDNEPVGRFRDELLYGEMLRFHENLGVTEDQGSFKWE